MTESEYYAAIEARFGPRIAALEPKVAQFNRLVARRDQKVREVYDHFRLVEERDRLAALTAVPPVEGE